jgi:hypothetical protein
VAAGNECVALPEHGSKPAQVTYADTKARAASSPTIAQNAILIWVQLTIHFESSHGHNAVS